MEKDVELEKLKKELLYYKRRTDELAGENVKIEMSLSAIRHQLVLKTKGFQILSVLHQSIGSSPEISNVFKIAIEKVNAELSFDKTLILVPSDSTDIFRPQEFLGFLEAERAKILEVRILIPSERLGPGSSLVVNKSTTRNDLIDEISKCFDLPYFVLVPIVSEKNIVGILVAGKKTENLPLHPPLGAEVLNIIEAVAGLISATIESIRVNTLKEVDRLKTEFFSNISHEFRTPITLTIGPLEALLTNQKESLTESQRASVEIMLRNQKRLLSLINQILDLAKLESGNMKIKPRRFSDFNLFCQEIMGQMQGMAQKKSLELQVELDPKLRNVDLFLDQDMIEKILFNLLSNACKFTARGFVKLRTEYRSEWICVQIIDSGIGIRPDQVQTVFDRFKQAEGSATREYAGTGIGLSLVKELVELHGGRIDLTSEYGKGSTFNLMFRSGFSHFPPGSIVEIAESQEIVRSHSSELVEINEGLLNKVSSEEVQAHNHNIISHRRPNKPLILYADDNRDLRGFVTSLLKDDYDVLLAADGQSGITLALECQPDLIISDLMMPIMSGTDFLRAAKASVGLKTVPFIILTAKTSLNSKIDELERGADDYIQKPFSEAELRARIKNLIELRKYQLQIKKDLLAARAIQQSLLPRVPTTMGALEVDLLYHPSEELSGDFCSFEKIDDDIYFYLADVMDHGTASAQVTYVVKSIFDDIFKVAPKQSLAKCLSEFAKKFIAYEFDHSVSITLIKTNSRTGQSEIVASNPGVVFFQTEAGFEEVQIPPGPLIYESNATYEFEMATFELQPGKNLFILSDGAFEFQNADGVMFGKRRLKKILQESLQVQESHWKETILTKLKSFSPDQNFDDDLSILRLIRL